MRRGLGALLAGATVIAVVATAGADLPDRGWPQARRDARLTARGQHPALVDPQVAWALRVGDGLEGEPSVLDCDLYVASTGGDVIRVNARDGQVIWRTAEPRTSCSEASPSRSSLALDEGGLLAVGLAADSALLTLIDALCSLRRACEIYAIDNNEYPPVDQLVESLVPTYMAPLPPNPCTGADMLESTDASAGDLRYSRDLPSVYHLGGWWSDDGVLGDLTWCNDAVASVGGPDPAWPTSNAAAGLALGLDAQSGARLWRAGADALSFADRPVLRPEGVVWAGDLTNFESDLARGRLLAVGPDGAPLWDLRRFGGARGSVARDETTGRLFVAWHSGSGGAFYNGQARVLAMAVEAYSIDWNEYPPTGELVDFLTPTYLRSLPVNGLTGEAMVWSPTPSPGDYDYDSEPVQQDYRISIWAWDGSRANIFETGSFTQPASEEPEGFVTAYEADGSLVWGTQTVAGPPGNPGPETTGLLLTASGSVVTATEAGEVFALDPADGAELWRVDVGTPLRGAPALLGDGGVAFVGGDGSQLLVVVDPPPFGLRFVHDAGAELVAAPTVSSDDVVLLADAAGRIQAVASDGRPRWLRDVGEGRALTTPVIQDEGWMWVGRADGVLVALVEGSGGARPPWPGGLLQVGRGSGESEAALSWVDTPLPAMPGSHYHLVRWLGRPEGLPEQVLGTHDFAELSHADATPGVDLACYRLRLSDCGENVRGGP